MAASKDTRRSAPDTNPFFLKLFRKSSVSKERERIWHDTAQHVGAGDIASMTRVKETEAWLHQSQLRVEEEKVHDPDDVDITVRQREAERRRQKLPPRIQFQDQTQAIKTPTSKRKTGRAN
jgi:hypothetical protein